MSKRKREIKKRMQQQEQVQQADEQVSEHHVADEEIVADHVDIAADGPSAEEMMVDSTEETEYDDGDIVAPSAPPVPKTVRKKVKKTRRDDSAPAKATNETSWLGQNKENLLLGMLVLYVFLLGLGTMGELFEIEWILNLPLFR